MDIKLGLVDGHDLKSLKHQSGIIKSNLGLGTESIDAVTNQTDPFFNFAMKVKTNIVETFANVRTFDVSHFTPDFIVKDRISKLNYANVRSLNVPCVPDTNARMADYLDYLDAWASVSLGISQSTIPTAKRFFAGILEDITCLEGAAVSSITASVVTHDKAIEILKEKYRGINLSKPSQIAVKPFGQQYSSIKDFAECCDKMEKIVNTMKTIDVDKTRKFVKELNEIISKIVIKAKQKKINVSDENIKAITTLLYRIAEEFSYLATCSLQTLNTSGVIEDQIETLKQFAI